MIRTTRGPATAAARASALQRRFPRAGWQDGRLVAQITHPSRLVGQSSGGEVQKQQLDTRVRNEPRGGGGGGPAAHLARVSFLVRAFGSAFTLDLELNHGAAADGRPRLCGRQRLAVLCRTGFGGGGSRREPGPGVLRPRQAAAGLGPSAVAQGAGEHCYYQGTVRGQPGSFAALSSCQGLHGVFSDGRATYLIEPRAGAERGQGLGPHVIRRASRRGPGCSEPGEPGAARGEASPPDRSWPSLRMPAQHTVHSETKYIELAVVNDHQLFLQLRKSVVLTSNFAKSVVNLADMIYKEQLNTRIVLVAMETWASEDRIRVEEDSLGTLAEFMKYRKEAMPEPSDTVHLFSGRTFQSSRSGTAFVGGICSPARGGGVNEYGNVAAMAVTLAQTLGQNVGMMWNKHRSSAGDCRCPDSWLGCIMEDTGYYLPRKFSRCSIDEYNQFLQDGGGSCLFNKPLKLLDPPECGNGFVEAGEECDCGSLAECARSGGNCCKKCTLTHDAMCSDGLWRAQLGTAGWRPALSPPPPHAPDPRALGQPQCHPWGSMSPPTTTTDVCPRPLLPVPFVTGPSGTNIIIGSIAGAVLVAAIVLGGTGWGFKNIRRGRYDPAQQGV
uniref:ADAM metallopeptidase domain 11 n=1 Tax=Apteryx owenii TaxID=8824 RepID=A0A8B9S9I5_APTOW